VLGLVGFFFLFDFYSVPKWANRQKGAGKKRSNFAEMGCMGQNQRREVGRGKIEKKKKEEDNRIGLLLGFNKDVFVGRVQTEQRIG
jgi:hypothetical protein